MKACLLLAGALLLQGCLPWAVTTPGDIRSIGGPADGLLTNGQGLPRRAAHYRLYREGERRFGTPELVGLIERSSAAVASEYPGSVLLVGDLSATEGGRISGHRSHQSGRDVDFGFFVSDPRGRPVAGHPLLRFDRNAVGRRDEQALVFDAARNWRLVEAMLQDEWTPVQWIFVSRGLKALLLEYGLRNGADVTTLERAASVLHQPRGAAPHDDHFHVRVYCPRDSTGAYCDDPRPIWPWVKNQRSDGSGFDDAELLRLAREGASP